jgi:LPS-assembly lipoprotein
LSSDRFTPLTRRFVLFGLLAGCGFAPVYGTDGSASALRKSIRFVTPDTVAGFRLRTRLEDRLGIATQPRMTLTVGLSQVRTPATITLDGATTRYNLVGVADWILTDFNDTPQTNGQVETFTSYSATGTTLATQNAETDAAARLSVALADLVVARLLLHTTGQSR